MSQYNNDRTLKAGGVDVRVCLYSDATREVNPVDVTSATSIGMLEGVSGKYTYDRVTYGADNTEDIDGGVANEIYTVTASAWKNLDLTVLHTLTGHTGLYVEAETQGVVVSKTLSFGGAVANPEPLRMWLVHTNGAGKTFIVEIYKVTMIDSVELTYGTDKEKSLISAPITIVGKPDSTRTAGDQLFKITDQITLE